MGTLWSESHEFLKPEKSDFLGKRSNFFRASRSKFRKSKCKFRENPNCTRAFKNYIARRLSISRCFNEKNITLFSQKPRLEFDTCATASCIYRFCKLRANNLINFLSIKLREKCFDQILGCSWKYCIF